MFDENLSNKAIVELIKDNPKYKYLWDKIKKCMKRYGIEKKYTDVVCECFYGWWTKKKKDRHDQWDKIEENLAHYAENLSGEYSCAVSKCSSGMEDCKKLLHAQDEYKYYKKMMKYCIKRCNRHYTIFGWCDSYKGKNW